MGLFGTGSLPCPLCRTAHSDIHSLKHCLSECSTKVQASKYKVGFLFAGIYDPKRSTFQGYTYCIVGIRIKVINGRKVICYLCAEIMKNDTVEFTSDGISVMVARDSTKIRDTEAAD